MNLSCICLLVCVVSASAVRYWKRGDGQGDSFEDFKNEFDVQYVNSEDEQTHKDVFEHNKRICDSINNASDATFTCQLTDDSDRTESEIRRTKTGLIPDTDDVKPENDLAIQLRGYMALRSLHKRAYTPIDYCAGKCKVAVKNQGGCGSCWAFSTTTTMEYRRCVQLNLASAPDTFSEQELVDCSPSGTCNGGWMTESYDYVAKQNGLCKDAVYPYTASDGKCVSSKCVHSGDLETTHYATWHATDDQIKAALEKYGPLAVTVKAGLTAFSNYNSGIINKECTPSGQYDLDHAVVLVGWGDQPEPHWIVQNSWGASWGEKGFVRIKMGKVSGTNLNYCNINGEISVPTFVKDPTPSPTSAPPAPTPAPPAPTPAPPSPTSAPPAPTPAPPGPTPAPPGPTPTGSPTSATTVSPMPDTTEEWSGWSGWSGSGSGFY